MKELFKIPQDSLLSLCHKLTALSGGRVVQGPGFDIVAPKASFFYGIYILTARYDGAVIDAILADAAMNDMPRHVSFTDALVGTEWNEALAARGFEKMIDQSGMLMELDGYREQPLSASIVRISADRLEEWSSVCETAFPKPSEMPALRYLICDDKCEFYAFLVDGKIAGTLLGYAEDGNYGIHEVATLPEYRRRGICEALVHHAAAMAKRAGNRYISLQSSTLGEGVYKRCGLRSVCTVAAYFLPRKP